MFYIIYVSIWGFFQICNLALAGFVIPFSSAVQSYNTFWIPIAVSSFVCNLGPIELVMFYRYLTACYFIHFEKLPLSLLSEVFSDQFINVLEYQQPMVTE